ncbi:MAG: hypothetical protein IIV02_06055 [Peptococcaceae bacterium]|nr:hypothetical protein [Peptococcaceae bacterium]
MAGSFTYNPSKIGENGKDKMRFELGDTLVDGAEITSPLCDEEYEAIIASAGSWKKAKVELLRAIAMKLSFQPDSTSIDGLSYSFSSRSQRWLDMLAKEEKEEKMRHALPRVNQNAIRRDNYFYEDMMKNRGC